MDRRQEWIAAGLYDPEAPAAQDQLAVLEWIAGHDVDTATIVEAFANGQLTSIVGDRALRPGTRRSLAEVSALTGLDLQSVHEVHRATGMPDIELDTPFYTDDELQMFQLFALAAELFSRDELVHFVRVMGASMRRLADAASEMFLRDVEAPLHEGPWASPLEMAKANYEGVLLARTAAAVFEPMFRVHLEVATQTIRRARVGSSDYSTVPLTVGFVDLREFTSRASAMSPDELLALVMRFESASTELVSHHGGRLVKLIGDEVMFTAVEPSEAVAIAAALVAEADHWANGARAGLAHGLVITSGGDVYGETVNLAARIVDIAVAGEVLVNEAVVLRAGTAQFSPAGRRQLKGFAEPIRLWSMDGAPEA